jgi:hypothetical protein
MHMTINAKAYLFPQCSSCQGLLHVDSCYHGLWCKVVRPGDVLSLYTDDNPTEISYAKVLALLAVRFIAVDLCFVEDRALHFKPQWYVSFACSVCR